MILGVERDAEYDEASVRCARDIAKQLLSYPASEFKVLMGGGSSYLMEKSRNGSRGDGTNIDLEWQRLGGSRKILRTPSDLAQVNAANDEKLLGIFSESHFPYYLSERMENKRTVPRLREMTEKAIEVLQRDDQGFFLVVEGEPWHHFHARRHSLIVRTGPETCSINFKGGPLAMPNPYTSLVQMIKESSKVQHREENAITEVTNWVPAMFFATGPGYKNGFGERSNSDIDILRDMRIKKMMVVVAPLQMNDLIDFTPSIAALLASVVYLQNKGTSSPLKQVFSG
ncbi:hypothetical protein OSTOST_06580 [Ostertagia ostertagi]